MNYSLFLFDLDDTLLDFNKSQEMSFFLTLKGLGVDQDLNTLYSDYQIINEKLWKQLENNLINQDYIKVERFRQLFDLHHVEANPLMASASYLNLLPQTIVLIDGATELLAKLSKVGEVGIITNGIGSTQEKRIQQSPLANYISFLTVSDIVGYAKPDPRIFEIASKLARSFSKDRTIMIGDRLEADILGAQNFGIDSCWFNQSKLPGDPSIVPTFEISHLSEFSKKMGLD